MRDVLRRWLGKPWGMIGAVAFINAAVGLAAFVKDLFLAKYLGTSVEADAFAIAFFLPDTVGNNLFASAVAVVCVPLFARAAAEERSFRRTVAGVIVRTELAAAALFAGLAVSAPWVLPLFGEAAKQAGALTARLLWIMLPTILLYPLWAVGTAALQSAGRFQRAAVAPLLFNGIFLLFVWGSDAMRLDRETGVYVIAAGVALGVVGAMWHVRAPLQSSLRELRAGWERVPFAGVALPYLVTLLCVQGVYIAERLIASRMGEGVVAGLTYAFRLAQLPIWTLIAAVTAVILPALAQDAELQRTSRLRDMMSRAIHYGWLLTLPIAALMYLLREPLISVLFLRGAFDERSLELTAAFLEGYALAIPLQAIALIGLRYFLASGRMKEPVIVAVAAACVTVGADVAWAPLLGPAAIGYGAAAGSALQAAAYLILLIRVHHVSDRSLLYGMLRGLAANAPAALAVAGLLAAPQIRQWLSDAGAVRWLTMIAAALAYAGIAAGLYYITGKRQRGARA